MKYMEVGIRALKQNASAVVARAAAGEIITITDRGRPVAQLTPLRRGRLAELIDAGLAAPATTAVRALPPPLPRRPGQPPLSDVVREARDGERW